ncbi:hypothetical protein [Halopenitus persicus]|uniref:hypothetical protein n=1 Tax=Halopenitus persicus TaxID=1048396 RepID=UPI000BBAC800|nr:hypothetical protein [Halopenitus persicus]
MTPLEVVGVAAIAVTVIIIYTVGSNYYLYSGPESRVLYWLSQPGVILLFGAGIVLAVVTGRASVGEARDFAGELVDEFTADKEDSRTSAGDSDE